MSTVLHSLVKCPSCLASKRGPEHTRRAQTEWAWLPLRHMLARPAIGGKQTVYGNNMECRWILTSEVPRGNLLIRWYLFRVFPRTLSTLLETYSMPLLLGLDGPSFSLSSTVWQTVRESEGKGTMRGQGQGGELELCSSLFLFGTKSQSGRTGLKDTMGSIVQWFRTNFGTSVDRGRDIHTHAEREMTTTIPRTRMSFSHKEWGQGNGLALCDVARANFFIFCCIGQQKGKKKNKQKTNE